MVEIPQAGTVRSYPPGLARLSYEHIGLRVFVDGHEIENVYAYSIPDGWVERDERDEHGDPVLANFRLVPERIEGAVEVRFADGRSDS